MALPTSYLTSTKNVPDILNAIVSAQAPAKFNRGFLEDLGFKASADRLMINMLKALGFLQADGTPTDRYFRYLDQSQSKKVLAEGIREAYADLFQLDRQAQKMSKSELKGKLKTLTRGESSDSVIDKMATTFEALAKQADFSGPAPKTAAAADAAKDAPRDARPHSDIGLVPLGGLVYSIQIHLPESRDPAVYDALFRSLKVHLL